MVKSKNNAQLTTHMPSAYLQAIQDESLNMGISASQRARDILVEHYNNEYLSAKNKVEALKIIESDELYKSFEIRESYRSYSEDE